MEITISEPIVEKVLDSCVGVDEKRYYKVQWLPTWEPEEEVLSKYQHLVEDFWKEANSNADRVNVCRLLFDTSSLRLKSIVQHLEEQHENGVVGQLVASKADADKLSSPSMERRKGCEIRPFKCDECVRSFPSDQKLNDHKRKLHSDLKTFPCTECTKSFTTQRNLQQHMLRHTGTGPHACHGCSKRFLLPQELEAHVRVCESLVVKDFQCDICSKRFTTKTHLQFHMKIHLPDSEKPFSCQYCPRTFAYKHDCVHHMRLHIGEKPFKCSECDSAFHRKSYLTEHMFVHTGISKYRCEECMQYFKTQRILQTHVKNIHVLKKKQLSEEEREKRAKKKKKKTKKIFECEECGKEFKFLKEYHYHKAVNHKDEIAAKQEDSLELTAFEPTMVYKCKKCEKTFNWSTSLKKHADTHRVDGSVGKYVEIVETSTATSDVVMSCDKENENQVIISQIPQVELQPTQIIADESHVEIPTNVVITGGRDSGVGSIVLMVTSGDDYNKTQVESGYSCPHCPLKFENEVSLNVHVLDKHRTQDLTEQVRHLIEEVGGVEQIAIVQNELKQHAGESDDEMSEEEIEDREEEIVETVVESQRDGEQQHVLLFNDT